MLGTCHHIILFSFSNIFWHVKTHSAIPQRFLWGKVEKEGPQWNYLTQIYQQKRLELVTFFCQLLFI